MYPEELVAPMRSELTDHGFDEFKTSDEVINHLTDHKGTTLLVINSVCGCAAGAARPGVLMALQNSKKKPEKLATVFAGVDREEKKRVNIHYLTHPLRRPLPCLKTVSWHIS